MLKVSRKTQHWMFFRNSNFTFRKIGVSFLARKLRGSTLLCEIIAFHKHQHINFVKLYRRKGNNCRFWKETHLKLVCLFVCLFVCCLFQAGSWDSRCSYTWRHFFSLRKNLTQPFYPVMHNLRGQDCVVVGLFLWFLFFVCKDFT